MEHIIAKLVKIHIEFGDIIESNGCLDIIKNKNLYETGFYPHTVGH